VLLHLLQAGRSIEPVLPTHAGNLYLETDSESEAMATTVADESDAFDGLGGPLAGAYGTSPHGQHTMAFVELPCSTMDRSVAQRLKSVPPSDIVSDFISKGGHDAPAIGTSTDPSAAVSCGTKQINTLTFPVCVWAGPEGLTLGYFCPLPRPHRKSKP
jgi:hypothetical protein